MSFKAIIDRKYILPSDPLRSVETYLGWCRMKKRRPLLVENWEGDTVAILDFESRAQLLLCENYELDIMIKPYLKVRKNK